MRRTKLFALMITAAMCMSLCACTVGAEEEKNFEDFRQELILAERISCRADITADFGDSISEFTVEFEHSGDESRITVLSPESIAGISAGVSGNEVRLEYDGLVLDIGTLTDDGLTPMAALPAMISALMTGYTEYIWRESDSEKEYLTAEIVVSDTSDMQLWLDNEDMCPVKAQLRSGGNTIITCEFSQWSVE